MHALVGMCPPGAVIADPFTGSGATLLAARTTGRRSIGVECDERHAERTATRLAQGDLFAAAGDVP
jgi:site-specific DNA-methyltransferase (adenine-specific)